MRELEKEKIIDSFDVSDQFKLKLCTGEFRGESRIDLRIYVSKEKGKLDVPTKKGIMIHAEHLDRLIEMTEKLKDI
ncbi:hypothetical protein ES695_18855 [Candidatus Atribacteria bacterium 1244-E10-H5-B2]|nr:MAG: hypothetical protein ES695_18855 [Candidatus Atribacteria bacterium 1244-E10-H5-B2]